MSYICLASVVYRSIRCIARGIVFVKGIFRKILRSEMEKTDTVIRMISNWGGFWVHVSWAMSMEPVWSKISMCWHTGVNNTRLASQIILFLTRALLGLVRPLPFAGGGGGGAVAAPHLSRKPTDVGEKFKRQWKGLDEIFPIKFKNLTSRLPVTSQVRSNTKCLTFSIYCLSSAKFRE